MNTEVKERPIIVTGAQPSGSGKYHLGNYLGALKNWAKLQHDYDSMFFIPDMHAITVFQKPSDLRNNSLNCVAQYIACGLDPEKATIFVQSHIVGHTELSWILGCQTSMGQLQRMTQFKDKTQKGEFAGAGLFYYPVLMAADILLYNAHLVPVGEDQKQHLEITRDLAIKFNNTYSPTFNVPEPFIIEGAGRIKSLQNPESKMSKSDPNQNGTLYLFEPIDSIRKKILSAVTDSGSDIRCSKDKPGISNLIFILHGITGRSIESIEQEFTGKTYAIFKQAVAEAVIEELKPIQQKYESLMQNKDYIMDVIKKGAGIAQKRAYRTLSKVYRKAGFLELPRGESEK